MKSLIEDYYAAFNAGDRERLLAMLDEHVVHEINEGGAETGREAFRAFLERMDLCYRERVEELVVFTDGSGTRAAAEFYIRGKDRQRAAGGQGAGILSAGGCLFRNRGGDDHAGDKLL